MITTITLNVSVDKCYSISDIVRPGTVSRVDAVRNTAGGKGINVARVARFCGEDTMAAGFVGGFNGDYVIDLIEKDGISHRFTKIASETRSCINILAADGSSTEYLEPGAPVSGEEIKQFLEDFSKIIEDSDIITISGSMPKGVPVDFYATMIRMVKAAGKKVILDTSGNALLEGIKAGPTMIKPNEEELEAILGIKIENRQQTIDAGKQLKDENGIEYVVISLGGDGAMLITNDAVYHGRPPKLEAKNTVGCGDSMVSAFAVAMKRGLTTEKALEYAVAVSAANAINPGTGSIRMSDVEEILPQVVIEKIQHI
ncbi:MAG: 1-phosphofructokinase [Lachnospiraceae bacterium]|nr:1-phosphofructokinase [Lachnospiraceae bacterium]